MSRPPELTEVNCIQAAEFLFAAVGRVCGYEKFQGAVTFRQSETYIRVTFERGDRTYDHAWARWQLLCMSQQKIDLEIMAILRELFR